MCGAVCVRITVILVSVCVGGWVLCSASVCVLARVYVRTARARVWCVSACAVSVFGCVRACGANVRVLHACLRVRVPVKVHIPVVMSQSRSLCVALIST